MFVPCTHRVHLDWLFGRINSFSSSLFIVHASRQPADTMTKGGCMDSWQVEQFDVLVQTTAAGVSQSRHLSSHDPRSAHLPMSKRTCEVQTLCSQKVEEGFLFTHPDNSSILLCNFSYWRNSHEQTWSESPWFTIFPCATSYLHDEDGAAHGFYWCEDRKLCFQNLSVNWYHKDGTILWYIRATQGHSSQLEVHVDYLRVIESQLGLVTFTMSHRFLDEIVRNGLLAGGLQSRRGRQACYFSALNLWFDETTPDYREGWWEPPHVPFVRRRPYHDAMYISGMGVNTWEWNFTPQWDGLLFIIVSPVTAK